MSKIIETTIRRFDGGIENDPRDTRENTCRMVSNFDVITNPHKMTTYNSNESGDSSASTSKKQNFCLATLNTTPLEYKLYALGVVSGQTYPEVLYKNLAVTSTNQLNDATWANSTDHQSASGTLHPECFVFYERATRVYGIRDDGSNLYVFEYDPRGIAVWDEDAIGAALSGSTNASTVAQGLVHSKDDILYIPYDNKIAKFVSGTGWTNPALSLSSSYKITSICEYGNFLAIGCAPKSGYGNSRVFLWNRDSTVLNVSESIDWGSGELKVLEEIDGVLVGISLQGNSLARDPDRIFFRAYTGGSAQTFKQILADNDTTTTIPIAKQKINNRLHFMMMGTFNGTVRDGVWSVGRVNANSPFILVNDHSVNDSTPLTPATDSLLGFFILEDFVFIAYIEGGAYKLKKTKYAQSYGANAVYESKRFNGGDSSVKKSLVGFSITHEALPSGGSVIVKYKTDDDVSWSSAILTTSTPGALSKSVTAALPKGYQEIEFQFIATGAKVEITGFSFKEQLTDLGRPYA